ncbi:bifunctional diguanylate cyclase/phosphodiesterase [Massilia sp. YMA4]|uniref:putative bifunctional diguanylate cyclase/phosphodiesterase n=1 Tax=Massilia sp. YMA4 TaxID=1593482 RepID=UPI000DD1675E|nr:EAL domain-containing protein [Massilia sp. YMA4]AXA90353.1 GGDEF domain-containing protein [Massilia sp. YMA4]
MDNRDRAAANEVLPVSNEAGAGLPGAGLPGASLPAIAGFDHLLGQHSREALLLAIGADPLPGAPGTPGLPAEREAALFGELHLLAPVGCLLLDAGTTILQVNLVGAGQLGIDRASAQRYRLRGFIAQRFLADFDAFIERARTSAQPLRQQLQLQPTRGEAGVPVTLVASGDGVHLRVTLESAEGRLAALEKSEERFRRIVQSAREGIWELDAAARTTFVNPRLADMLGYRIEDMLDRPLVSFMDAEGRSILERNIARRQQGMPERREFKFIRRDGSELWAHLATSPLLDAQGGYLGALALVSDITQHKEAADLAWHQANFDALTGLPNRNMFQERLRHEMRKARRDGSYLALLFIDLDQFKQINDTFGHAQGDALLIEATRRIGGCMRASDTLARIGGDEFVAILPGLAAMPDAERVAQDVIAVLNRPFDLSGQQGLISGSVGIALYPSDAADAEELLRHADQAMYAAKNGGRNRYSYFTPDMQAAAQQRLRLASELRRAAAQQEFELYYQPIINLQSGGIERAEALLRWHHPERGLLNPGDFIAGAESAGVLQDIGAWAFRQAADQVLAWQRELGRPFQISINRSPAELRGDNHGWRAYLDSLQLPPRSIVVDVPEDLLGEADGAALEQLRQLRAMGLQVALDDFGTGHSALAQLKQFDIDYLKIDRSFVAGLTGDSGDLALCEAIIVLAHKLGLEVVAEGVENDAQLALLRAAGCDYAQGYGIARPAPAGQLLALARSGVRPALTADGGVGMNAGARAGAGAVANPLPQ